MTTAPLPGGNAVAADFALRMRGVVGVWPHKMISRSAGVRSCGPAGAVAIATASDDRVLLLVGFALAASRSELV